MLSLSLCLLVRGVSCFPVLPSNLCFYVEIPDFYANILCYLGLYVQYCVLYPTKLCAVKTGIKNIGKDPRMLHLMDPPIDEREDKISLEQDIFYERIYLPKNLIKSTGKFILKPRHAAHPFSV